jgi:hypothetical protein
MSRKVTIEFLGQDKSLGKTMGDIDGKSNKLMGALGKVGKAAAIGLAAGAAAGAVGLFKLTQGAVEDEAAQKRLEKQLQNSAGATDRQVAAVESWISAQGKALGVTDDELRPALEKLVTATVDVGEAQKLAALAMDVSAGSGKSLDAVSTALMKAQNGQVSGLSRLGIETKNAAGETLTFEQATKKMAETFGGQAASQAQTLDGKMARLKLILSETGETIGSKMIPVVTQLADWFLNKGVPAISTFGNYVQANLLPALTRFGSWVQATILPALARLGSFVTSTVVPGLTSLASALNNNRGVLLAVAAGVTAGYVALKVYAVATKVVAAATAAWTVVQKVLNGTLKANPVGLVVTAIGLLVAGLVVAYQRSETFRNAVDRVASFLRANLVPAISAAIGFVGQIIGKMVAAGAVFVDAVQDVARFANGVREKIGAALQVVGGIPGKALAALGNLGSTLWSAGSNLIQGLIDGITSKVSALRDKLSSITKLIPDWKGPLDKDKILLTPAGVALMEGLVKGIDKGKKKLQSVLEKITDYVKGKQDKLADLLGKRQSIIDSFKGFSSSVFGASLGTEESPASVQKLVDFSGDQRARADQLNASVGALISKGLSRDLIQQMIDQGQSGVDQINLLATATDDQIRQLNANNAATTAALAAAGLRAADAMLKDQIDGAQRDVALADTIRDKLAELLEKQEKNTVIQIKLGGRTIHATLRQLKRELGQKLELD